MRTRLTWFVLILVCCLGCSKQILNFIPVETKASICFSWVNELSRFNIEMLTITFTDSGQTNVIKGAQFNLIGDSLYSMFRTPLYEVYSNRQLHVKFTFTDTVNNRVVCADSFSFKLDSTYTYFTNLFTIHKNNVYSLVTPNYSSYAIDTSYCDSILDSLYVNVLSPRPIE